MKKTIRKIISIIVLTTIIMSSGYVGTPVQKVEAAVTHPFLIADAADIQTLKNNVNTEPWKSLYAYAKGIATGSARSDISVATANYLDCTTLCYVLETDATKKTTYKNNLYNTIYNSFQNINVVNKVSDWNAQILGGNVFFCGVIAYDFIYNDLTSTQRTTLNNICGPKAQDFRTYLNNSWQANSWGAYGIWQLFAGNTSGAQDASDGYVLNMHNTITNDGVAIIGPQYTKARYSADRYAKQYFMDVLAHTGTYDCYSDPEFIKLYEWFYGHALTPFKNFWIFADAYLYNSFERINSIYKAANFSDEAGAYAQRLLDGYSKQGGILAYALHKKNVSAKMAPSKIYKDGGAFLYENSQATTAQASALWNIKPPTNSMGHSHKEVNAINVVNYGQTLLANAGYPNWDTSMGSFPFEYFNNRAVSANTALINYSIGSSVYNPSITNDHVSVYGGGVTEGIASELFGYASGDSGSALSNGKHIRNLVSVFPQDSKYGYWVLFDEVDATSGGVPAGIALHPVSRDTAPTVTANQEYKWSCNFNDANNPANISVFLGTAPSSVQLVDGCIASNASKGTSYSVFNKYIYSKYTTDSNGKKNIVTVLFPSNASHAKATMARISGTGYTGASINLGSSTIDYALESSGTSSITYGNATFQGLSALYREVSGANKFYFVRKGKSFRDGNYGFTSDSNASVYMKGTTGNVVSPGTYVTFYYPGVTGVKLNDELVASTVGNGTVKVYVEAGDNSIELTTGPVDPVDPEDPPVEPEDPDPTIDADGNRIFPVKYDAYVQSGANADTQYGNSNLLITTTTTDADWSRKTYLNFGLSKLDLSSFQQAKLRLYVSKADAATSRLLKLYGNSNEAWTESGATGITWNNAPAPTTEIASYDATGLQAGTWLEFDVTNYINNHMTDKKVSFELINESSIYTSFNSKEATANQPQLVITPGQSQPVDPVDPTPDPTPTTDADGNIIVPVKADAYVQSGANANTEYGANNLLITATSTDADWSRKTYAKFGFSSLTQSSIYQAKLRLYVSMADAATSRLMKLYGTNNEWWTEADTVSGNTTIPGITWANAPEPVTEIASYEAAGLQAGTWLEFDVTNYVNNHMSDKAVSFELVNESSVYTSFNSKEATANKPQLVITPVQPDPDVTVTINPTADSFVFGGEPDANKGTLTTMESKGGSTAYIRRPYFKFNFSTVTESSVKSAKLKLYVYNADAAAPATPLKIFGNSVESWAESTITYNNAPANTTEITSTNVSGSQKGTWVEFDITSYINSQTTDKIVSLELINDSTNWYSFYSKESNGFDPQLEITY